jgi:hypothetical protein
MCSDTTCSCLDTGWMFPKVSCSGACAESRKQHQAVATPLLTQTPCLLCCCLPAVPAAARYLCSS